MARKTGNVKWFSNEKGYGFIEQEDGDDVFVHHSDIKGDGYKTLQQDELVEYEIIQADKGPKAQDVVRLENGGDSAGGSDSGQREPAADRPPASGEADRREEPEAESSLAQQLRQKLSERFLGGS